MRKGAATAFGASGSGQGLEMLRPYHVKPSGDVTRSHGTCFFLADHVIKCHFEEVN
jgi:hypothetical protein